MASERLEGLAREMYAAELEVFEDGVAYGRPGVEWDCLSEAPTGKPRHRAWASAACEYFGFVNAKGKVVVPKRGAGAALAEAVKALCNPEEWLCMSQSEFLRITQGDQQWKCPWCDEPSEDGGGHDIQHKPDCPVAMGRAALRSLQGGDDGCPRDA